MRNSFLILLLIFSSSLLNAQISQFRGSERNGKFPDKNLLKEWPENGPQLVLDIDSIGKGYASAIATDKYIYVTGMIDTLDYLTCIDYDGNKKWQIPYGQSWKKSFPDSRCAPTIDDDRIYLTSGIGELVCLNAETGNLIWEKNIDRDYAGEWHVWGVSESPLVIDDKVICSPAGNETSIVALDKMTGEEVWKTKSMGSQRAYSSPVIYEYKEFRYILANTAKHIMAILPETGEIVWSYNYFNAGNWTRRESLTYTNNPIFKEDQIFLSKGYDFPAVMLQMDSTGTSVSEKFIDHTLDNHHHGLVEVDGFIYGSNWKSNRSGKWVCMNWETGEIEYVTEWKNKGSIIYADGMLYCYEEKGGTVGLAKASSKGFEIISSFKLKKGSGPHWAHPYIHQAKLFLRHGTALQVFNISQEN